MIREFFISVNDMAGQIPTCIGKLAYLQVFNADTNQLSGVIPPCIGKLRSLHTLDLHNNQVSGCIPTSIGNLTMLNMLSLYGNHLQGHIPSVLGISCRNLAYLYLFQNNISGKIPSQLLTFSSSLIELDLSNNRLSGPLPAEVAQLKSLTALGISNNMLSGEIPSTLGACLELSFLYMDGNLFQGTIPPTLVALSGLIELDFSRNNLYGEIPKFLVNFYQLDLLNLSYNNLEGEVPTEGVFRNTTALSILGNSRLCGGIPELKLPPCMYTKTHKRRLSHKTRLMIALLCGFSAVILLLALVSLYASYCRKKRMNSIISGNSHLSYQSLFKATDGFSSENLIGSGSFGVVYKGNLDDQERTIVAIKVFNFARRGASKSFMAECEVLRNIRHRNLVKVITTCSGIDYQGNDFKALVYKYMVNGSLEDWLHWEPSSTVEGTSHAPRNLNFTKRLEIAVDVAFALEYLHHQCGASIIHCDLKPSNVLLDDEMVAHVGDFGLAKFLSEGVISSQVNQSSSSIGVRGTVGYAPPEYGVGNEVSTSGDVYSFGILLLEMFTGKRPTDDMFKEGLSLHNFVKAALPEKIMEIVDHALIQDIVGEETSTSNNRKPLLEALISILEIALSCSIELPRERLAMSDVAAKLSSIKNTFITTRFQQQRRNLPRTRG